MKLAPIPPDDATRLEALRRYRILDTAPEEVFNAVARLASTICQTPIAALSFVDEKRQWFKAEIGLNASETQRDVSFCGHAISERDVMVVPDAREDERFADNPFVTGELGLRFYAGAPLITPEGHALGTLCVIDRIPRELRPDQEEALAALSQQVIAQLEASRKLADQAAEATERRFHRLLESALDIITVLGADGCFRYQSPALQRVLGYSTEELTGRSVFDFIHPEDQKRERDAFELGLGGSNVLRSSECRFRHKDGSWRVLEVTGRVIPDGEEDGPCAVLNVRDVTERKMLEEQLRTSQKMDAIGRLAGGIAHDFNNLLTIILGYTDVLEAGLAHDRARAEEAIEIRKAAERAAGLTRQLLAFSRRQVFERRTINLNALLGNLEKMLQRVIGEDVALATNFDPELGNIRADSGQIEQVIMNLAVNARDAMPKGGKLTIETRGVELDDVYAREHLSVRPGRYVMVAVTDTGTGMDAETKSRLFEPFFTTKEQGKGTGLGLATVYGIVKQSGGTIWVYSEPGHGTTFKVYLPEATGARLSRDKPVEPFLDRGSETILLTEDEEALRVLARKMLSSCGYTVLESSSAFEALEIARSEVNIDLLLTDVVMPEMSGSELAAKIQEIRPEMRVLFMSGYTDDVVIRHGMLKEGCTFLQKPFTANSLARKVREALASDRVPVTAGD